MPEVSIIICTLRRDAFLRALVQSLRAQMDDAAEDRELEIVVVDNDPAASAREAVASFGDAGVRYVHEAQPGVSHARNAGVAAARAEAILFLDDDQLVGPTFIRDVFAAWRRRPTYLRGLRLNLEVVFEDGARSIADQSRHLTNLASADYAPVARGAFGTGGLIIERRVLCEDAVPFRPELGLSGGEDTDFFLRASERGYHFGHVASVTVMERVTVERARLPYQLRRQFRSGQLDAALDLAANDRMRDVWQAQALDAETHARHAALRKTLDGIRDGWGEAAPPARLDPIRPLIGRVLRLRVVARRALVLALRGPQVLMRGKSATVLELQHLAYAAGRLHAEVRAAATRLRRRCHG